MKVKSKVRAGLVAAAAAAALATASSAPAQAALTIGGNVGNVCASQSSIWVENSAGTVSYVSPCQNTKAWLTPGWAGRIIYVQIPNGFVGIEQRTGAVYHPGIWYRVNSGSEIILKAVCYNCSWV